jgi:hypothetical protein
MNLNLLGQVWQPAANYNGCLQRFKFKKNVPNGNYYRQQAAKPDQITQNSLQRAGGP